MSGDTDKPSSRGRGSASRASSGNDRGPASQPAADTRSFTTVSRPRDAGPVQANPTELILDFRAPGRDTRRPLTRRGHVKSRLGCLSCKRRRVKCDERHPVCGQCTRLKLPCLYPPEACRPSSEEQKEDEEQQQQQQQVSPSSSGTPTQQVMPRSVDSAMNLDHLAFYHQFLTVAYPTIPIKEASAWADCAAMSHHYDYLAHAVLALGASHLTVNTGADWTPQTLYHRTTALRLISERLSEPIESSAEGDALMGALICLAGQSSLLTNSVHEYVNLTRGSYLVSQAVVLPLNGSMFKSITDARHLDLLITMFEEQPKDVALIEEYRDYVESLSKICKEEHELQYQSLLYRAISLLSTKPLDAVRTFTAVFVLPCLFDNDSFSDFIREDNHTANLLVANMFLLDYLLGQTCMPKRETPKFGGRKDVIIAWVHKVVSRLPEAYRDFGDFPLRFCKILATYDPRYLFWP